MSNVSHPVTRRTLPHFLVLCLVGASCPRVAAAPVAPIADFGAIAVVLGLVALIGLGLSYLIARKVGVAIYASLLAIGLLYFHITATGERTEREAVGQALQEAVNAHCYGVAGETGATPLAATRVFVRVDPLLSRVGEHLTPIEPREGVEFVTALPTQLSPDAAYLNISYEEMPIAGARARLLSQMVSTITSGDGTLVARRLDVRRQYDWCLGESAAVSNERFARRWLGVSIGLVSRRKEEHIAVPSHSPKGHVTPLSEGRFAEQSLPQATGLDFDLPGITAQLPTLGCEQSGDQLNRGEIVCAKGTRFENSFNIGSLVAIQPGRDGWLAFTAGRDWTVLDGIEISERTATGVLKNNWHVRLPRIALGAERQGPGSVANMSLDGTFLRADLLFGKQIEVSASDLARKRKNQWFKYKSVLTVDLSTAGNR